MEAYMHAQHQLALRWAGSHILEQVAGGSRRRICIGHDGQDLVPDRLHHPSSVGTDGIPGKAEQHVDHHSRLAVAKAVMEQHALADVREEDGLHAADPGGLGQRDVWIRALQAAGLDLLGRREHWVPLGRFPAIAWRPGRSGWDSLRLSALPRRPSNSFLQFW